MEENMIYATEVDIIKLNDEAMIIKPRKTIVGYLDGEYFVDFTKKVHKLPHRSFFEEATKNEKYYLWPMTAQDVFEDSNEDMMDERDIINAHKEIVKHTKDGIFLVHRLNENSNVYLEFLYNGFSFNLEFFHPFQTLGLVKEHLVLEKEAQLKEQNQEIEDSFNADELEDFLKSRVISQDEVCTEVVDTIYKNIKYKDYEGMKSNILLIGPSGVGKTEISRTIAMKLNRPFVIFDVSNCTATGYVGPSATDCLRNLYLAAGKNLEKAENGIVVLDEIDKIASGKGGESIGKQDVQYEFLKMLDGDEIEVPIQQTPLKTIMMKTKNITFIASGAFSNIYETRKNQKTFGFGNAPKEDIAKEMTTEELSSFGLLPELLRRFPVRLQLNSLSREDLKKILVKSSISPLTVHKHAIWKENKVKLVCSPAAINAIIDKADTRKAGASGLKAAVDQTLIKALRKRDNIPKDELVRELVIKPETVEDPHKFNLRLIKKRNVRNELSKETREIT